MFHKTESRAGTPLGLKVALLFTALGFISAASSAGVTFYLNTRVPIDAKALQAWSRNVIWAWPTSIMMMATESSNGWIAGMILVASVIANACLFGVGGLVIGTLLQKLSRQQDGSSSRPS